MKRLVMIMLVSLSVSGCAFNSVLISYPSQIAPIKAALNRPTTSPIYHQLDDKINTAPINCYTPKKLAE